MSDSTVQPHKARMRLVAASSLSGALLEWYDFQIYALASALVFAPQFFPEVDPIIGILVSFATFGAGFVMRPIGSIVLGHFGDRVGRKTILVLTMVVMGLSTFFTGLLPNYATIGIWAPILLVFLRLAQGFSLGGEFGGAALLAAEHSAPNRRGFWASFAQVGNPAGIFLATAVFTLSTLIPTNVFNDWGWRVPFLLSGVLLIVGLRVRLKVEETPVMSKLRESGNRVKVPFFELLKFNTKTLLLAALVRLPDAVGANIFNTFALAYLTTVLGMERTTVLIGVLAATVIQTFTYPIIGRLSDSIGRKSCYLIGGLIVLVFAFPFFLMINTGTPFLIWVAIVIGMCAGSGFIFATSSAYLAELFPPEVRYTGSSLAFQLSALVGGLAPLAATSLLIAGGDQPWLVAAALTVVTLIAIVAMLKLPETAPAKLSRKETA